MKNKIFVVNPNSLNAVTQGIDAAVDCLRSRDGTKIRCLTLESGPAGIQSQRQIDSVVMPLCDLVESLEGEAAAFVIACFSDPGLHALREIASVPVLGIAECGMTTAMTLGQRIGVVSILEASVPRHLRMYNAMGIANRVVGDVAIGLSVSELSNRNTALDRMVEAGRRLRNVHGADVLVMGCAGMSALREGVQSQVGLPTIDPTQAAVAMALGRVKLGW